VRWLWAGVILFSLISVFANWLAGISHMMPIEADVGQFGAWLVSLRPILLSGVLPMLVIYLSEIVSSDYQNDQAMAQKLAQKEARRQVKLAKSGANDTGQIDTGQMRPGDQSLEERKANLDQANDTRQAQIDQRRERVRQLLSEGMSQSQMADELGVSSATVKRDTKAVKESFILTGSPDPVVSVNGGSKNV
jgi:DNA-binding transcriptional regulator YiaG